MQFDLEICGICSRLFFDDKAVGGIIAKRFGYFLPSGNSDPEFTIHIEGIGPYTVTDIAHDSRFLCDIQSVARVIERLLCSLMTPRLVGRYIQLHAGAVCVPGGGVVGFTGESGSGKSTLTAALVELGTRYVTDDNLLICLKDFEACPIVEPYPLPIYLRQNAHELLPGAQLWNVAEPSYKSGTVEWQVNVDLLGKDKIAQSGPLTHLFLLRGFAAQLNAKRLSPYEALLHIPTHSSMWLWNPLDAIWFFSMLLHRVACYSIVLGTPLDTAKYLLNILRDAHHEQASIT